MTFYCDLQSRINPALTADKIIVERRKSAQENSRCLVFIRQVIVNVTTQSQSESSWLGLAKFAWSGSVIECLNCGEIYRSRQYWYGNKSPEDYAVKSEIVHVWRGSDRSVKSQMYSAQMLLDGVSYLAETVSNLSAQPSKAITDWATDKIAPDYWVPNAQIIVSFLNIINLLKIKKKTLFFKLNC